MAEKQKREYMKLSVVGVDIIITTPTETIEGFIACYPCCFCITGHSNEYIFEKANIRNIKGFHKKILGYCDYFVSQTGFPYSKTSEDVIKLVRAVVDYNNRHVGDHFDCPLANRIELRKKHPIKFNFNL